MDIVLLFRILSAMCLLGFQPEFFKLFRSAMFLCFYAFALSGRAYYIFVSHTQGAASLALG